MSNFIQWHEGMLLSPHHFQQSDNHIQHLFSLFGSSVSAFFYGVRDIKVDTSSLGSGVVRILKVNGIFQDGYCFDFDAIHDHPLEKNLSEYFVVNFSAVKIFLAIPARRIGENELSGDIARYYSDEIIVNDENTGEHSTNISILKPRLKLLLENEVDARYISFPVLEVEKSADGGIVCTKFIPPYIVIDEHSRIAEMCRDVAGIIRGKVAYFTDRKDNFACSVTDESMSNLRLLVQAALPLEAMIKTNGIQPFEIYKLLLTSVAKIISINPTQLIPRIPPYNHNDLYVTFDGLLSYAKNILDTMKQQYSVVHFNKDEYMFKLQMKKEWLQNDEIAIGVQGALSSSDLDLMRWISGLQIASESMLQTIKDRRILGAERSIMERGSYITQPNGMKIISIKTKSAYIKPMEKLCLVNPSCKVIPEEVILYAD
jgi:type VI secretion system protein ImpJ